MSTPTDSSIQADIILMWRTEEVRQIIINAVASLLADEKLVPNGDGTFHFQRA